MSKPTGHHWTQTHKGEDLLGPDFVARTFSFSSAKGPVETTLVNHVGRPRTAKAILYIHGYTDYFFQSELAEYIIKLGYRFYAIDLQGYGRSIRPNHAPNRCHSMGQYEQDIDIALATMKADGVQNVVILAHSTGGLIASSYLAQQSHSLQDRAEHYGKDFPEVTGLILNSPFLSLPFSPSQLKRFSRPVRAIVSLLPFVTLKMKKPSTYAKTLHTSFGGEWDYRLDWKPSNGFGLSFQWLREIIRAQRKLSEQQVDTPTLLCSAEFSTIGKKDMEEAEQGDNVLDVDSMLEAAQKTFPNLTSKVIHNGFHDLYLSRESARNDYLLIIKQWLNQLNKKD